MHELAVWLTEARYPHYFVNNCNLVDSSFNVETIKSHLTSISKPMLSLWFVNNYIRKCSQLCPRNVSLFDDVSTSEKLQNAVSAIAYCRTSTVRNQWHIFLEIELVIILEVSKHFCPYGLRDG